jgi:hypothetical protein
LWFGGSLVILGLSRGSISWIAKRFFNKIQVGSRAILHVGKSFLTIRDDHIIDININIGDKQLTLTANPDLVSIQYVANYLVRYPQQSQQKVLEQLYTIQPKTFYSGKKLLIKNYQDILLCENCNTVILSASAPISIRINETNEYLTMTTLFSYSGDAVNIYVTNPSIIADVNIKFVWATNETEVDPYVYS